MYSKLLNVTKRAARELSKLLYDSVDMPQARLRILDRGQGVLGLGIDIEGPTDYIIKCEGSSVLVIGKELVEYLKGVTLDIEEGDKGDEFVFLFPIR
ncbi:hypothetical protein ACFLUJ_03040 [Chloroflexota bacterium]